MKKIALVTIAAALLAFGCSRPAEPPSPEKTTPPPPPPKVMFTVTSKSPEATKSVDATMDYMANVRWNEANAEVQKALAADPDNAMAHALLGTMTPGTAGMEHLTKAEELSASATPAEKAFIQSLAADRRGEDQAALDHMKAAVAAAPDDWRMHFNLGQRYFGDEDLASAHASFVKAAELGPTAGAVHNSLGYVAMRQGKPEDAIASFTKYTELSPNEANAQDSLAEAYMAAGRYDEAEAGFQKALALDAAFFPAWGGIAQTRFLKGDWAGGRDALAKERELATRDQDKASADMALAWSYMAEGKPADALKTVDQVEAFAKEKNLEVAYAFAPLNRGYFLELSGKAAKAMPLTDEAMKRATDAAIPGGPMAELTRNAIIGRIEINAKLGKAKEAQEALASLEAELAKSPATPAHASLLAYARGQAALASKDYKAAAEQFAQASMDDAMAHLEHAKALKAAGDEAAAGTTAQQLLSVQRREPSWLYVSSEAKKLAPPPPAPAGM